MLQRLVRFAQGNHRFAQPAPETLRPVQRDETVAGMLQFVDGRSRQGFADQAGVFQPFQLGLKFGKLG